MFKIVVPMTLVYVTIFFTGMEGNMAVCLVNLGKKITDFGHDPNANKVCVLSVYCKLLLIWIRLAMEFFLVK